MSGVVRIGCYPSLAPTALPVLISEFTQANPDARIEVMENTQDQLSKAVETGELDLAIMYDLDLDPTWKSVALARLSPSAVLPAGHRLADTKGGIDLAHLRNDPMVLLDAPPSSNHAYFCCAKAGFAPKVIYRARTYETARSFVGRGFGWTLLLQRPSTSVSYEGKPVVVKEISSPVLPDVAVNIVWHPESLREQGVAHLHHPRGAPGGGGSARHNSEKLRRHTQNLRFSNELPRPHSGPTPRHRRRGRPERATR